MKQIEEELKKQEEAVAVAQQSYDALLEQAQQLQQVAQARLVSIRLLETFANDVNAALNKMSNDMRELGLQAQAAQAAQAEEATEGDT